MFRSLGLWDDFVAEGHAPCLGSRSAWGDNRLGYNDYLYNPHGQGWHLDRRLFRDAFLMAKVAERGMGVLNRNPLRQGGTAVRRRLSTAFDRRRRRRHDADGPLRRRCHGGSRPVRPSARSQPSAAGPVVVAAGFFEVPEGSKGSHLTLLEATEYGWWYAARLPGGQHVAALATDAALLKEGLSGPASAMDGTAGRDPPRRRRCRGGRRRSPAA